MRGQDGTHDRRGDVKTVRSGIRFSKYLIEAIETAFGERMVLSRRIEVSSVHDGSPLDSTTRRKQDAAVSLSDNLQSGGECGRCIIYFYDPRFVLLYANGGIVTDRGPDPIPGPLVQAYRETTRRCEPGIESEEDCLASRPFVITSLVIHGVMVNARTIVLPSLCSGRVRYEERESG